MSFSEAFIRAARSVLPMPFTIAVLLTFLSMILAFVLTSPAEMTEKPYWIQIGEFWETGFWDLLKFSMQMMLILVLGHVLALTKPADALIRKVIKYCSTTARAAGIVTLLTVFVGLLNWGLGLVFGAIFARKVGEHAEQNGYAINYPLIGAAGYSGMMVWHGGLSGSAPLKVAEAGHFLSDSIGMIPLSETLFSSMNLTVSLALLVVLPLAMAWLGTRLKPTNVDHLNVSQPYEHTDEPIGAERLDRSPMLAYLFGGTILFFALNNALFGSSSGVSGLSLSFLTPNYISFVLLGLGIVLFGDLSKYVIAVEEAIGGATGILIQFPLYAGIAGIIKYSGLITILSDFMVAFSNEMTFPLLTLVSAGIVNVFVPSGGGQLAVQGPIIVDAAGPAGVSFAKSLMAMSYGDQLTNMMQPFWALPLLGITRLRAQEILPFTLYLMGIGGSIFILGLLLF